jgi:HTH-type transcriptional regulator, competence development regulator
MKCHIVNKYFGHNLSVCNMSVFLGQILSKMTKQKIISFGEYIRQLREEAELPLRKVAAQLDIDPSLLGKIERNERPPTKEIIDGIAKIFKVDAKYLHIEYISDQFANKIIEEEVGIDTLRVAEKKVQYLKANKTK